MGVILEFKRQAYSGAVADMAEITPADGDTFHATDTDQLFIGHGGSWVHHPRFFPRPAAVADFDQNDLTLDGAWHVNGFNLSGIVPVGTVAVALRVVISDDAATTRFELRTNASTHLQNVIIDRMQVANVPNYVCDIISIDPDRLLDYFASVGVGTILVTVIGWWV